MTIERLEWLHRTLLPRSTMTLPAAGTGRHTNPCLKCSTGDELTDILRRRPLFPLGVRVNIVRLVCAVLPELAENGAFTLCDNRRVKPGFGVLTLVELPERTAEYGDSYLAFGMGYNL